MKRLYNVILIVACTIVFFACGKSATPNPTYCTNIAFDPTFSAIGITVYVNETYTVPNDKVIITPSNAIVQYTYVIADESVASIQDNTITACAVGQTYLSVTAPGNTGTVTSNRVPVNVIPEPVYVTECSFEHESVSIDKGHTATNNVITNEGINVDEAFRVSYTDSGVVTYDINTGVITAISGGTTQVIVNYRVDYDVYRQVRFDVTVNSYASSVTIDDAADTIILYVGQSGKFNLSILPSDYTFGVSITSSSDIFTIDNEGNYVANSAGSADISIQYVTSSGTETNTYHVQVKQMVASISLQDNTSWHYVNEDGLSVSPICTMTLSANVPFDSSDIDALSLSGVQVDNLSLHDGNIIISYYCTSIGQTTANLTYHYVSFDRVITLYSSTSFTSYYYIINANITGSPIDIDIDIDSNIINLYLCDEGAHASSTQLVISIDNLSYTRGYDIQIGNSSIAQFINGEITAKSIGNTTLTIHFNDEYLDDVVINVVVNNCSASSMLVDVATSLYVGNTFDTYSNTTTLNVSLVPSCSTDVINVATSSPNLQYNNGTITALASGNYTITITTRNLSETIDIVVYDMPNDFDALIGNESIINTIQTIESNSITIVVKEYFDSVQISNFIPISITSNNVEIQSVYIGNGVYSITFASNTNTTICLTMGSIVKYFDVNFNV